MQPPNIVFSCGMLPNVGNVNNSIQENYKKQQQPRHLHQLSCTAKEKYKYESSRRTTNTNEEGNIEICSHSRSVCKTENKKPPTSDSCEKPNAALFQQSNIEQGYQIVMCCIIPIKNDIFLI